MIKQFIAGPVEKRFNSVPSQGIIHGFESRLGHHQLQIRTSKKIGVSVKIRILDLSGVYQDKRSRKLIAFFCFKIQRDFLKVFLFQALILSGRGYFLKLESWAGLDNKTDKSWFHITKLLSMELIYIQLNEVFMFLNKSHITTSR